LGRKKLTLKKKECHVGHRRIASNGNPRAEALLNKEKRKSQKKTLPMPFQENARIKGSVNSRLDEKGGGKVAKLGTFRRENVQKFPKTPNQYKAANLAGKEI